MEIVIRKVTKKDLPKIQELQNELQKTRQELWKKSRSFHERTNSISLITKLGVGEVVLVAKVGGELVGFVFGEISKRSGHTLSKMGYISELFISKNFRNQGISTLLIKSLVREFKSKKCDHIITHTDWENEAAQALYKSLGMTPVTVELWKKI